MPKTDINLLPKQKDNLIVLFLNWALTVGRVLVIVTELVALLTFLYRFSLDMQLSDLNDKIKNYTQIITLSKNNEDMYRTLQARLLLAKKLDEHSTDGSLLFQDIINQARGKVTFESVIISTNAVRMQVNAGSVGRLMSFINSLKQDQALKSISIDKVENKTSSAVISVAVSATLTTPLANE